MKSCIAIIISIKIIAISLVKDHALIERCSCETSIASRGATARCALCDQNTFEFHILSWKLLCCAHWGGDYDGER